MKTRLRLLMLLAPVAGSLLSPTLALAETTTPEARKKEAVEFVTKANEFLKANGKAKLLETLNTPENPFHRGELYVFAYDFKGTILAHINPKLVGKELYDVPDPDGKFFRRDIVDTAKSKKTGWVDYKYKNPVSGSIEEKTTYVMNAGDVILTAGVYK